MANKTGVYEIPFMIDQFGIELCSYDSGGCIWKMNYKFNDDLRYRGYDRGRSSAVILFESEIRKFKAQMFMKDFDEMMKLGINPQEFSGYFTFVKRGQNYGLKYLGKEK